MSEQPQQSSGQAILRALAERGMSQAELARSLPADPSLVSKWVHDTQQPGRTYRKRLKEVLELDLAAQQSLLKSTHELYVAAPITGLAAGSIDRHREKVQHVVSAARRYAPRAYWPGESIRSTADLVAPDIATERNLEVMAHCAALLYLQFDEVVGASGALVELGIGLGRRLKTTVIVRKGLHTPFLLREGFGAVAARLHSMPNARVYFVEDEIEAASLVERNQRVLFGLD